MECPSIQEQLSAYLDGEISLEDQVNVKCHLESCESCAREYEQLRRMTQALGQIRYQMPTDMWPQIQQRITERSLARRRPRLGEWWTPFWRPLAAAALLVFGALAYFWLQQPAEDMPLDYYLEAHADFAVTTSLIPDSMVAFVLPDDTATDDVLWDDETDLMLEWHFEDN